MAVVVGDGELDSPVAADVPRSVRRLGNKPAKFEQRVPFRTPGNAERPDAQFARRSRGTFAAALEADGHGLAPIGEFKRNRRAPPAFAGLAHERGQHSVLSLANPHLHRRNRRAVSRHVELEIDRPVLRKVVHHIPRPDLLRDFGRGGPFDVRARPAARIAEVDLHRPVGVRRSLHAAPRMSPRNGCVARGAAAVGRQLGGDRRDNGRKVPDARGIDRGDYLLGTRIRPLPGPEPAPAAVDETRSAVDGLRHWQRHLVNREVAEVGERPCGELVG